MGSSIEINDTLKISKERGFPAILTLDTHVQTPRTLADLKNAVYNFWNADERLYHRAPTRVFLVEEINGKWLYWGHANVIEQTIDSEKHQTRGKFIVTRIYAPDYQRQITQNESPIGKSYFS